MVRFIIVSAIAASVLVPALSAGTAAQSAPAPSSSAALETAMRAYWAAPDADGRATAAKQILASGASFDAVLARLKTGRPYGKARTGTIDLPSRDQGIALENIAEIPAAYDPARRWPLRVSLHGGVGREPPAAGGPPARPLTNRTPIDGEIVIHPRAWAQSEWWTEGQVQNIARLVERVKHDYNVDESRTYITGISDGGTGVYFFGMRAATAWSACMPLNGHPSVLANPDVGADGQLYARNLANCPLYIVNGGRDPLYPAASVAPLVEMMKRGQVPLVFQVYPEGEHNVNWWPQERPRYEGFLTAHARVAHPDTVTWETERTDRYSRFRWLVIDRLGKRPGDVQLADVNTFHPIPAMSRPLYDRSKPSGRVDGTRRANAFDLKTRGVQQVTLLLSSDVVDFARPVRVTVNGTVVHDAVVKPSVETLLAWAARDDDRTMLYGAALKVLVP